jgi:lysophospholipase L1-like esterase
MNYVNARLIPFVLAIALFISFTITGTGASYAQSTEAASEALLYVALGDSLTVGYEPGMTVESTPYGFVERIYEQALYHGRTEMMNFGLVGLTSSGLNKFIQSVSADKLSTKEDIQPALIDPRADAVLANHSEIKAALESAGLITITIGGNDFYHFQTAMAGKSDAETELMLKELLSVYSANLASVLQLLYQMNPDVYIIIADQYQPYPPLDLEIYKKLSMTKDAFTQSLNLTIQPFLDKGFKLGVATVSDSFVGHEIEYTHIIKKDIHPNQAGYEAMAKLFSETIWNTYQVKQRANALRVIVRGKEMAETPLVVAGTAYVPLREYGVAFGANVDWDAKTKSILINYNGIPVQLQMGSETFYVAGQELQLSGAVRMYNDKTYIPLRSITDKLGFELKYIKSSNTVYIN